MGGYTLAEIRTARSLLFVPGNRADRFAKAMTAGADIVVIDLEDAVGADEKDTARAHAEAWLAAGNRATMLRINATGTPWHDDDLALIDDYGPAVMLPKSEGAEQVDRVGASHLAGVAVVALVETAAGVLAAPALAAHDRVARLAFGSIDLGAQLGVDPDDRTALLHARSALVIACAAVGCAPPIDGVTTAVDNLRVLSDDVDYARRLGMTAKLCIHPQQVAAVHAAMTPSADLVEWAQKVMAVAESDGSAIAVDGQMIDKPVVDRARAILADVRCTGSASARQAVALPGARCTGIDPKRQR
jgi:citrate lyase subunit beta/citryl-CoA lyase